MEEHIDILLETGKKLGKIVNVHVDQFNSPEDKETELLCDKTVEHGMEGRVVAIHCISLASHPKDYRKKVYKRMQESGVMAISCPTAWIDSPRSEENTPRHNSLTPIDEMVPAGVTVALGTDNIADYMVPFCDGDIWFDLKLLATGCRFTDYKSLVDIATVNGLKVLGIENE